jgi:hypothetical protein
VRVETNKNGLKTPIAAFVFRPETADVKIGHEEFVKVVVCHIKPPFVRRFLYGSRTFSERGGKGVPSVAMLPQMGRIRKRAGISVRDSGPFLGPSAVRRV